jgi:hypothetical protein
MNCTSSTLPRSLQAPTEAEKRSAAGWLCLTTDAEFDAITVYFQAPAEDEKFNVIRHERA